MSLVDRMMVDCERISFISAPDGQGGYVISEIPGNKFKATITINKSNTLREAEKVDVETTYTITFGQSLILSPSDLFRSTNDKHVYRVTSKQISTPIFAGFSFYQVQAEDWKGD